MEQSKPLPSIEQMMETAEAQYRAFLLEQKSCAISELGQQKSALDYFTIQELETLSDLLNKEKATATGRAYSYWLDRLHVKTDDLWYQKRIQQEKALKELEDNTNWTKALKNSKSTSTKPNS